MKEKTSKVYICGVCGTEYDSANKCLECERTHVNRLDTLAVIWAPGLHFPKHLYFKDFNGRIVRYSEDTIWGGKDYTDYQGRDPRTWDSLRLTVAARNTHEAEIKHQVKMLKQPDSIWTRLMDVIVKFWRG